MAKVICEAVDCKYNSKGGCTGDEINIDNDLTCTDCEEDDD